MMPAPAEITADLDAARAFLTLLDESAEAFTFQTFDDNKRRKDRTLAAVMTADFDQVARRLVAMSQRGAGVFVTVNETDGHGRLTENISRVRAVWHEDDAGQPVTFPLQPHITVESSPGKFHRYWLVDGLTPDQFAGVMRCLVKVHGSDPNARDISRVLRLPGFCHQKDAERPHLVRVVSESGELPYLAADIIRAFPEPPDDPTHEAPAGEVRLDRNKLQEIRSALAFVDPTERDVWLRVGMALHSTGAGGQAFGIWDEWSQKTGKANYDPANQRYTWDSFGRSRGRQTTLASLFDLAQRGGWVVPSAPRNSPHPVTDIQDENALRLDFEQRIAQAAASTDTGDILLQLTPAILGTKMREATRELLLRKVKDATGVPVSALRRDAPKRPRNGGDGKAEKPKEFVDELNQRHTVVPVGGKTYVLNRDYDPGLRRKLVTFSGRPDFVMRYENRYTIDSKGEKMGIGTFWLKSPDRSQHEGVVFVPGGTVPGYYNLWTGWGIQPKPGECGLFTEFVHEIICGGSSALFAYVWGWCAHMFQHPQTLPGTALVLRGAMGIGKNRFAETLGRLVGAHFIQLNSLNQVTGRFSGHLADVLLVFANEAIWGGDKSAEGALKAMVTDPYSPIESKGKDIRSCANYKRLIVASNEDWAIPRGKGDRRFVICDVSAKRKEDRTYFSALMRELRNGGYAALMHEMMTANLSNFDPAQLPAEIREAGWELAVRTSGSIDRWWFDVLQRGYLYYEEPAYAGGPDADDSAGYIWPDWLATEQVQTHYLRWCERHRVHHPESVETLGRALSRYGLRNYRPRDGKQRIHAYQFPTIDTARVIYAKDMGIPDSVWIVPDDEELSP